MLEIILISIVLIGCLSACWAIFHVKKHKKKDKKTDTKKSDKKEDKPQDKAEEPAKITEDIKLTKNEKKLKIVKSATLTPKVERVYAKEDDEKAEEEPVVVVRTPDIKPKKAVNASAAKSIERVFSGKKEEATVDAEEQVIKQDELPKRTPSIADRIEFREHLAEIYGGFGTGLKVGGEKTSVIDKLQEEEKEDEKSVSFSDARGSSMWASYFGGTEPTKSKKEPIKINMKDMVLAEAIMKRPKLSKNLKNFNKK